MYMYMYITFYFTGEGLNTGRIAVLLCYCYRLIQRLEREGEVERKEQRLLSPKVLLVIAGVGVIGLVATILYKVLVKIDFFNLLLKKGGWVSKSVCR